MWDSSVCGEFGWKRRVREKEGRGGGGGRRTVREGPRTPALVAQYTYVELNRRMNTSSNARSVVQCESVCGMPVMCDWCCDAV